MTSQRRRAVGVAALLFVSSLLVAAPADAHLVQTGFGEFYDGIGHLLVTLPDLFVVVAVGLLAGSSGPAGARRAVVALPLAWLAAGLLADYGAAAAMSPWVTTLLFGVLGALVALDVKCAPSLVLAISVIVGIVHGWSDGASIAEALREDAAASGTGTLALLGSATAVFAIVTLLSALVVSLRSYAARIVVRVAGSWLTAIAMLMVGWLARARGTA